MDNAGEDNGLKQSRASVPNNEYKFYIHSFVTGIYYDVPKGKDSLFLTGNAGNIWLYVHRNH